MRIFVLGRHLRFDNCGGLGRGNICREKGSQAFRAEKPNKHARVLTVCQAPGLKKLAEFSWIV